jgi:DNA/RNA endonuclease YhcR with UshA esterase domain
MPTFICATGKTQEYNGKPEIILTDPQQTKPQSKQVTETAAGELCLHVEPN